MLLAQTSAGLARRTTDGYDLLTTEASLGELIRAQQLDTLAGLSTRARVRLDSVTALAPVARPGKVCIVGLNYTDHAREIGAEPPTSPRFSWAAGSSVV